MCGRKRKKFVLKKYFSDLDGNTVRGCTPTNAAWLKKISENDEYELCSSDQCNGKVFPENRLHCLHCSGLSCVNQSNTIDVRHPCVNYVATDECYTIFQYGKWYFGGFIEFGDFDMWCIMHTEISIREILSLWLTLIKSKPK